MRVGVEYQAVLPELCKRRRNMSRLIRIHFLCRVAELETTNRPEGLVLWSPADETVISEDTGVYPPKPQLIN